MSEAIFSCCGSFVIYIFRYKKQTDESNQTLKKVYFFWICPDTNAFEWLHDLLKYYDREMEEAGSANFLSYFIYLTRGWDTSLVSIQS